MMQYIAFTIYRDIKRSSLVWILTLEKLPSLAFRLGGHKDGADAGVRHLHVGTEFEDGLALPDLAMGQEPVGHLITLLPHVLVVAELLHRSFQDFRQTSAVLKVEIFLLTVVLQSRLINLLDIIDHWLISDF